MLLTRLVVGNNTWCTRLTVDRRRWWKVRTCFSRVFFTVECDTCWPPDWLLATALSCTADWLFVTVVRGRNCPLDCMSVTEPGTTVLRYRASTLVVLDGTVIVLFSVWLFVTANWDNCTFAQNLSTGCACWHCDNTWTTTSSTVCHRRRCVVRSWFSRVLYTQLVVGYNTWCTWTSTSSTVRHRRWCDGVRTCFSIV